MTNGQSGVDLCGAATQTVATWEVMVLEFSHSFVPRKKVDKFCLEGRRFFSFFFTLSSFLSRARGLGRDCPSTPAPNLWVALAVEEH